MIANRTRPSAKKRGSKAKKIASILIPIVLIVGAGTYFLFQFHSPQKIGIININGTISGFEYAHLADKAKDDPSIEAVVVRINSPGGGVTGSFQTETALNKLSLEKPVIANMEQVAASGAYIISTAANHIYAHEHTITAGLGVIALWVSYADYYENLGIEHYVWKTGDQKDMFAPWRKPTEKENKQIQGLVENFENQLYEIITTNRPETISTIDKVKDGDTVYGTKAVELGLVDNIGSFDDAVDKAAEMAGLEEGEYKKVNLSNYFSE